MRQSTVEVSTLFDYFQPEKTIPRKRHKPIIHRTNMKITLYKSSLCPRCHFTRKALEELVADRSDITIEYVDVLSSPRRMVDDGIRMIPALVCGNHRLSGIWLGKGQLSKYLEQLTDA